MTLVNRDGAVTVVLTKDARDVCGSAKVGDYFEVDGVKDHEQLSYADNLSIAKR